MEVYPANHRLFGLAVQNRLSLSLLRLTFLLSPNKQNEKLIFGLPMENLSPCRLLARLSLDEAASRTELELELLQCNRPRGAVVTRRGGELL